MGGEDWKEGDEGLDFSGPRVEVQLPEKGCHPGLGRGNIVQMSPQGGSGEPERGDWPLFSACLACRAFMKSSDLVPEQGRDGCGW